MNVSSAELLTNRVKEARQARGWSQHELARHSGLSRSSVSAIEIARLIPSAAAALALARAFECPVEQLFSLGTPDESTLAWAAAPRGPCRYWHAALRGRRLLYSSTAFPDINAAHDGTFDGRCLHPAPQADPQRTLIIASCDPAAGLLAEELQRTRGIRLLIIPRSSRQALALLRDGLVHAAGLHLSRVGEAGNATAAAEAVGPSGTFCLLRAAQWEEGLAVDPRRRLRSVRGALRGRLRWIGREPGSGAAECLTELRGNRPPPRHQAQSHRGVAEAIRAGLADAGVCLRLVGEQAGLDFLSVRREAYDLCFSANDASDPRLQALVEAVRSPVYHKLLGELPGYSVVGAGDLQMIGAAHS